MCRRSSLFLTRNNLYGLLSTALILSLIILNMLPSQTPASLASPATPTSVSQAFNQSAREFHVPVALLKTLCYLEGHMSANNGDPSIDQGFGCMHLVKNKHFDTLDRAAQELKVNINQLKRDTPTNIRGGAAILRDDALQISHAHRLPTRLADWYGAVAMYSDATTRSTALMYADAVYTLLGQGFSASADDGEIIALQPQSVQPDTATAAAVKGVAALPSGCRLDNNVDYPGAVDCILTPNTFDCNITPTTACNFTGSTRPTNCTVDYSSTNVVVTQPCKINQIVIHDIEGSATSSLDIFQNPQSQASAHYIVDSNGTIYQIVREKDISYHDGDYWSNQHSIGIEHTGFDSTGYRWYNATEYLASAKLVAYLLKKYHLPLDRAHILAHGTVPSPSATSQPNHVDPGPYWLWDYYFGLIHQQGVAYPATSTDPHIFMLRPATDRSPDGKNGAETSANFNFFYLYNGPSTASGRIPQQNTSSDITDVTDNVEPDMSYYYLTKVTDPDGTGDTMYKIWYGVEDQAHATNPSMYAHAKAVWLAVPRGAASPGIGTAVTLHAVNGQTPLVYGQPTTSTTPNQYVIGNAPAGAIFVSGYSVTEDGTNNLWYEIDYNHRQGWVPSSEVTLSQAPDPTPTPVLSPDPTVTPTPTSTTTPVPVSSSSPTPGPTPTPTPPPMVCSCESSAPTATPAPKPQATKRAKLKHPTKHRR